MTPQEYRAAMRRLPSGVSVITTMVGADPTGMTATSVSSLSADPPSLLVCINQSGSMHAALQDASHFAVNVLAQDHAEVAQRFADPAMREERFSGDQWLEDESGVPYLGEAQASFVCRLVERVQFATHTICIGEVERVRCKDTDSPLVYFNGAYRNLQ